MAALVTIPRKLGARGDLVVIPRKEYEALLRLKAIRTFKATDAQKRSLREGRKEFARGAYVTLENLLRELGSPRR